MNLYYDEKEKKKIKNKIRIIFKWNLYYYDDKDIRYLERRKKINIYLFSNSIQNQNQIIYRMYCFQKKKNQITLACYMNKYLRIFFFLSTSFIWVILCYLIIQFLHQSTRIDKNLNINIMIFCNDWIDSCNKKKANDMKAILIYLIRLRKIKRRLLLGKKKIFCW